jgi:hypothetical protein
MDPDSAAWYENYSTALLALSRTDEAESVFKDAFSRGLDDPSLHLNLYTLAFMKADAPRMQDQLAWAEGKKNGNDEQERDQIEDHNRDDCDDYQRRC